MSMNDNQYDFALLMDYQHVLRSKSDPNLREQKSETVTGSARLYSVQQGYYNGFSKVIIMGSARL